MRHVVGLITFAASLTAGLALAQEAGPEPAMKAAGPEPAMKAAGPELAMVTAPEERPRVTTTPARTRPVAPQQLPGDAQPAVTPERVARSAEDDRGEVGYDLNGEDEEGSDCALGDVCLGPVLNLGVINPVGFGLHARVGDYVGFGGDYQFLPEVSIGDASTSASLFTVDARVYPFGGAFFLSAGFAYQVLTAAASAEVADPTGRNYQVEVEGSVGLPMAKFGLGFFGHDGLVMGIDLALEVPLADKVVSFAANGTGLSDAEMAEIDRLEADVEQATEGVLDMMPVLVQVNLLRLGYVF